MRPGMDFRIKLLLALAAGVSSLVGVGIWSLAVPFILATVFLLVLGQFKTLAWGAAAACALLLSVRHLPDTAPVVSGMVAYLLFFSLKMTPLLMIFSGIACTSTLTELFCALDFLRFPRELAIPVAVTVRFMPTLRREIGHIRDAMSIRGIRVGLPGFFVNPIDLFEYLTLPMLVRCCRLADELAASAMTRGLDAPERLSPPAPPLGLGGYLWLAGIAMAVTVGFVPMAWVVAR
jgi:energy-coupling factor transport system permease protein